MEKNQPFGVTKRLGFASPIPHHRPSQAPSVFSVAVALQRAEGGGLVRGPEIQGLLALLGKVEVFQVVRHTFPVVIYMV